MRGHAKYTKKNISEELRYLEIVFQIFRENE